MVLKPMPQTRTNLLSNIEGFLPPTTFALLRAVAAKASEIDTPLYLVGGSVRDALLGSPVRDLDMVVEGNAALLAFEASKELSGDVLAYSQFGTATVKLGGVRFDLATARKETYPRPGALPRVTPSTIQEDLVRRDFSINAMAVSLSKPQPGRLLDPQNGRRDLKLGLIRVLHPESFVDDPTRIFRAIRYEQRFNFRLESETQRLLEGAVKGRALDTVSPARTRREQELILQEEHPGLSLSRCGELGVLRAIHPSLGDGAGVKALARRETKNAPLEYLAALSYPLTTQDGEAFVNRLRMPSRWAKVVRDTIAVRLRCGDDPASGPHIGEPGLSSSQLRNVLDQFSITSVQVNASLSESPRVKEALELYLTRLRYVKPSLNGSDLICLGVSPGPLMGELLRNLRNAKIDGRIATRDDEVQLAKEYIRRRL